MMTARPAPALEIHLLGAPSIVTPLGAIASTKPFVFAAALYVGLNRGRAIRREELATLLWPDAADAKRGERMRWLVRQLKLAGLALGTGTPEIVLAMPDVVLDADALATTSSAADILALVSADVLAGYHPEISDGFARWLDETRGAYRANVLHTLAKWLATSRRGESWRTMETVARRMLALDDGRADATAGLAEALLKLGMSFDAVADASHDDPLIGRDMVLARLTEALAPSSGAGHRLAVAGPAGIGKTRLLEELVRLSDARGIPVVTVRCQRGDALRPLSLAVDLTRVLLQLPGALGASPHSIEVLGRFTGEHASPNDGESAEARRTAVYEAVRDLVGAVTDEAGLLVVVDDAQWAEAGSWALLAPAIAQRSPSPLCWAVTIRAESREVAAETFDTSFPRDDALSEQQRELFWLAPLDASDIERLCARRAAPQVIPPAALATLASRAAGIPFIANALADHWLDVGDVRSLPPSVARLVRGRIDRLSVDAAQLLRSIAVLGLDATPPAAEAVASFDRRALMRAVNELETSGILRMVDGVLSAHALWVEATLNGAAPTVVQLLHRNAAEWLEREMATQELVAPRLHWAMATHWLAAGDQEKARRVLDRSATVLAASGFITESAEMLERAGHLAGQSPSALRYFHRAALLVRRDFSLSASQTIARLCDRYDKVARIVEGDAFTPHHDLERLVLAVPLRNDTTVSAEEVVRRQLACAGAHEASSFHRLNATSAILYRYNFGVVSEATATSIWHTASIIVPTNEREALELEFCAADYYARVIDRPDIALQHAKRGLAITTDSEELDDTDLTRGAMRVADCFERMGDVAAALSTLRNVLEQGRTRKNRHMVTALLSGLVGTLLELGRSAEVRPLLAEFGRESSRAVKRSAEDEARIIYRAVCALEEGDAAMARTELTVSLEESEHTIGIARARFVALHAHLALLENDDAMLGRLLPQLLECFTSGGRFLDHPALVTALILERFEGWAAAAAFVRRFMTDIREERWTPRKELQRYLDGAEQLTPPLGRTHGQLTVPE